jgi:hypothetical protein
MFRRFEGICRVTMASRFAGFAIGVFMNPREGGELVVVLGLGLIGLMAALAIGIPELLTRRGQKRSIAYEIGHWEKHVDGAPFRCGTRQVF